MTGKNKPTFFANEFGCLQTMQIVNNKKGII